MGSADHGSDARDKVRVMLVDDDLFVRSTLSQVLGRVGQITITGAFASGAEAAGAAFRDAPDVALVDIAMPGMDGVATTAAIRAAAPAVRVVALTSLADERSAARMLDAGAVGFLAKDTPVPAMVHAILAAADGLSVLSKAAASLLSAEKHLGSRPELSDLDLHILRLLVRGQTNTEIAAQVFLSPYTVKYHLTALMAKLDVPNRISLAVRASELGVH